MADYGASYTDKEIAKLEKEINAIYEEAEKDIQQKMDDFNKKYEAKEKIYAKKVADGKITQEEFDRWKKGQVFQGKQWEAKREQILNTMHHSNEIATKMINGETTNIFMTNANYMSYDIEHGAGVNFGFGLYDSSTVVNLIKNDPQLLPKWKIDEKKDYIWSQKKLNNSITQGIIQGESLDKIANRLSDKLVSTNKNKMKTFARTAMTGAQNSGRQMQLENAKKMGIDLMKEWMATLDSHTRDSHKHMDGEQVEVDKEFSNGLMYPGEPGGAPAEVYNCFIPETNVALDSEIIRSYKHYYSGKIVSIKSARGVNFSCTPNHPILTDRGWIAAESLNNGDHLIVTFRKNNIFTRINPNINHRLTRMDTIHEFFDKFGTKRTCRLGVNFHGDIPTSNVEIVTKKRFLRDIRNISFIKNINKFLLKFTNAAFVCKSSFMKHFKGIVRSSFGNIGSISKLFSFISRSLCHSNVHGLGAIPDVNLSISEYPINNLPADPNFFGESLIGLTGKIFLDDIISVDVSDFTGHVYNLQTKNNYYFVNNNTNNTKLYNSIFAIAHNCRCTMVSDVKKYPSTYDRYDNISGQKIKNMSYEEWEDAKKNGKDLSPVPLTYKMFKTNEQKALMDLFKNKSMSSLYKDMKDFDKTEANQFYKTLSEAGKPSEAWQQYLNGTLNSKTSDKIDEILNQYGLESGIIAQPIDLKLTFADKKMSNVYNDMKALDKTAANKFYNDLKDMGKPSEVWDKYLKGELSDVDTKKIEGYLEKMIKNGITTMVKPGEVKTFEEAQKALKAAEDAVKKAGADKEFTGIWKDPVTYADYEAKAASIQAKKDYYLDQIAKYKADTSSDPDWLKMQADKYAGYLKQLEEFEKNGKAYSQLLKNVEDAKKKVNDLTSADAVFSQKRKDAALWARNDAEYKKLDKYYDKVAKDVHNKKTSLEHEGYYHYTWGSGPFNQPLAGFDGSWSESAFKGVGKVDIDDNGYGNKIRGLTNLVEKSKYDKDVWLQSGQTTDTLAGFLNIPRGALNKMSESELQQFVGVEKEISQFISGAINKGGGSYTPGDTLFNIYCPEGSEMLYVRSDGHFKKNEHEMILQRGGTYKIDKIYWGKDEVHGGRKLVVDLELHPERGYDKFQQ